jgi:hypothetical protein
MDAPLCSTGAGRAADWPSHKARAAPARLRCSPEPCWASLPTCMPAAQHTLLPRRPQEDRRAQQGHGDRCVDPQGTGGSAHQDGQRIPGVALQATRRRVDGGRAAARLRGAGPHALPGACCGGAAAQPPPAALAAAACLGRAGGRMPGVRLRPAAAVDVDANASAGGFRPAARPLAARPACCYMASHMHAPARLAIAAAAACVRRCSGCGATRTSSASRRTTCCARRAERGEERAAQEALAVGRSVGRDGVGWGCALQRSAWQRCCAAAPGLCAALLSQLDCQVLLGRCDLVRRHLQRGGAGWGCQRQRHGALCTQGQWLATLTSQARAVGQCVAACSLQIWCSGGRWTAADG